MYSTLTRTSTSNATSLPLGDGLPSRTDEDAGADLCAANVLGARSPINLWIGNDGLVDLRWCVQESLWATSALKAGTPHDTLSHSQALPARAAGESP
jgi:hypothetical protein